MASAVSRASGVFANSRGTSARRAVSRMRATKKRSVTTATTRGPLLILLDDSEPVLVPLREMTERGEVRHPIDVHDAVQMVGLVLDDAREEIFCDQIDLLPVTVVAHQADGAIPRHLPSHVGHRETAFPPG